MQGSPVDNFFKLYLNKDKTEFKNFRVNENRFLFLFTH